MIGRGRAECRTLSVGGRLCPRPPPATGNMGAGPGRPRGGGNPAVGKRNVFEIIGFQNGIEVPFQNTKSFIHKEIKSLCLT